MQKEWPSGLVGEIAQFIHDAAPKPVREIAMVGAVGLLAGITGRAYNVSATGLNQYILFIGGTGTGKEAIASGISKLMTALKTSVPTIYEFVGPTEIASPQALTKWLSRAPCIYSIVGEFGLKLREMSAPHAPAHIAGMKRTLLDLYHKSGSGSVLGAQAYSKKEDNIAIIQSPAFTLIGESTPERFFEAISEDVVTDGLLPRFSVVQYFGVVQKLNKHHGDVEPSRDLIKGLAELAAHCLSVSARGEVQNVASSSEAEAIFDRFEEYTIEQINGEHLVTRELWNRAYLKAMKLAALYAVGSNYVNPRITSDHAQLACDEINAQTVSLILRFASGEVGTLSGNEERQYNAVVNVIAKYLSEPFDSCKTYGVSEALHGARIIPVSFIQRRLLSTAAFKGSGGGTPAINRCLQRMSDADEIRQVPKQQMVAEFSTATKAYAISNPELFVDAITAFAGRELSRKAS